MKVAITHHRMTKNPPPGFPPSSAICANIIASYNNGLPLGVPWAGAWTTTATPAMVNAGIFIDNLSNVQVTTLGPADCSAGVMNGGQLQFQYNENPVGDRVTLDINAAILPPGLATCAFNGRLYSVWNKDVLNDPNHTPGTPNPSSLSRGVIDHIRNP